MSGVISGSRIDSWDPEVHHPARFDNDNTEYGAPLSSQLSQAVVRIREMILRSELLPGTRVAEAPLADLLGTSRTPVRQALPLLAREGLLTEHETRGYVVRAFTTTTSSTRSSIARCSKVSPRAVSPRSSAPEVAASA